MFWINVAKEKQYIILLQHEGSTCMPVFVNSDALRVLKLNTWQTRECKERQSLTWDKSANVSSKHALPISLHVWHSNLYNSLPENIHGLYRTKIKDTPLPFPVDYFPQTSSPIVCIHIYKKINLYCEHLMESYGYCYYWGWPTLMMHKKNWHL